LPPLPDETPRTREGGVGLLGVTELAGLVHELPSEADIGGERLNVPGGNLEVAGAAVIGHLATLLRRILFVGEQPQR